MPEGFVNPINPSTIHPFNESIPVGLVNPTYAAEVPEGKPSPEFVNSQLLINKFCPQHKAYRVTRFAGLSGTLCITKKEGNSERYSQNKEILNSGNSCEPQRLMFQNDISKDEPFNHSTFHPFNFAAVPFPPHPSRFTFRKAAFTLAEVLITLGIIGVVAAMTLPALIQKNQEKVTVSRLKKTYSALSQAYLMISKDYGEPDNWGMSAALDEEGNSSPDGSLNAANLFARYMKITKNCGIEAGCWHTGKSYRLDGRVYVDTNNRTDIAKIKLADGTHVAFGGLSGSCDKVRGNTKPLSHVCSWIIVDINGNDRPNTYGIDIFEFVLTKYNILPYGTKEDTSQFNFDSACKNSASASGNGCTAWVIYNENMDYRRCNDLEWGGKTKCN